jgi:hypothetical protein
MGFHCVPRVVSTFVRHIWDGEMFVEYGQRGGAEVVWQLGALY